MQDRSSQTLHIERLLSDGHTISSIARTMGVSRQWVQQINKRRCKGLQDLAPLQEVQPALLGSELHMKSLTLRLTLPVYDALTEACAITNRKDPEEPITTEEYVEECVTTRLQELGLLRRNKRK